MATMGLYPDVSVDFDEYSLPQEINDLQIDNFRKNIGSYESAAQAALKNRQDLQALGKSIEASKSSLTIAESGYYPSVSAFGGWSWANSELNQFDELGRSYIGLSLRVPIFDQFNTNYQIQSAKAQLYQQEVDKSYQEKLALSQLKISYLNLEAAEKKLEISQRSYKAAENNYESYKERFDVGKSNVTDLLNANKLLVEAQINRTTAVYDYFGAQKSIEFNLGQLEK
jgi:outer membrane protein